MIATVLPRRRISAVKASTSELLPAPGGPVTPTISPLPSGADAKYSRASGAPFSTCVARRASSRVVKLILQQLPGDHQTLDLAGAFADRTQLHIAIELLDRIVLDEAIAAMYLDRFPRDPDGRFR